MIKMFENINGVFIAKGGIVLDYKSQDEHVLAEFDEFEFLNFIKLVRKFRTLSMENIDKLSLDIIDQFIADVKYKLISSADTNNIDIRDESPITVVSDGCFEVSYTFCPELGRIVGFNHKIK